jgi:GA-binding protein transcription factor beta
LETILNNENFSFQLGTSALHIAAKNNFYDTCAILIRSGISKDAKTKVDRTPLHFAVFEGNYEIAKLLVQNECSIDSLDMVKSNKQSSAVPNQLNVIAKNDTSPLGCRSWIRQHRGLSN